mmetsp:Transcript_32040/g.70191  ORF Transcript_32040/g.70191 Transcript_32040/m.70191 type:complete len:206 (-) Transcript_32040:4-621(-)
MCPDASSSALQATSASSCAFWHAACAAATRSCSWASQISSAPRRCFCSKRHASTRLSAATATGREKFVRADTIIRSSTLELNRSWAVWNSRRMAGWISSCTVGSNTSPITSDSCGDNFPPACAKTWAFSSTVASSCLRSSGLPPRLRDTSISTPAHRPLAVSTSAAGSRDAAPAIINAARIAMLLARCSSEEYVHKKGNAVNLRT